MKIEELREQLEVKKTEIRGFLDEKKATEAEKAMEEKRNLEKLIKMQEDIEAEEKRDLENQKNKKREADNKMEKINEFRAIVKQVMGEEVTAEERATITTSENSAVLPKEFINQLIEIEKGYGSLEEYVDVIPVTKNEGTMPISVVDDTELPDVLEGDTITDASLTTTPISFKCSKVGEIYPLTSELVDDAEIEIEGLARRNFTAKTVKTKNARIMKVVKDNAVTVTATGYKDINKVIDEADPSVKRGLVTFTNSTGYSELKNKEDLEGRPLNLVTEVNGKYYFSNKELVVVDASILPTIAGKAVTYYVCNPKELVKLFTRKQFTVARSTEAGFDTDTVKVRLLGRFGISKGYARNCFVISY